MIKNVEFDELWDNKIAPCLVGVKKTMSDDAYEVIYQACVLAYKAGRLDENNYLLTEV